MKYVRLDVLKHIEDYSVKRVQNMAEKMKISGCWERPICIEENHLLILDGQHRYEVAKLLGFKYIPAELFNYEDPRVITWSLRKDYIVTKKLIIDRSLNNNIYPYKTAKHKFPRIIKKCMLSLKDLEKLNYIQDDSNYIVDLED